MVKHPLKCIEFLLSNFWANERPSSSDEENETENFLYSEVESQFEIRSNEYLIEKIETVKDLDVSKNELKSLIRKHEYRIKLFENKNNQLENELKSFEEGYNLLKSCKLFACFLGLYITKTKNHLLCT